MSDYQSVNLALRWISMPDALIIPIYMLNYEITHSPVRVRAIIAETELHVSSIAAVSMQSIRFYRHECKGNFTNNGRWLKKKCEIFKIYI